MVISPEENLATLMESLKRLEIGNSAGRVRIKNFTKNSPYLSLKNWYLALLKLF